MLADLKFVQGAVAKKDYDPTLTHFCIRDGKILGYNGALALCTPTDLPLTCAPKAVQFVKAVQTCRDTVEMHLTPNGRLCVRSGSFTAHVECLADVEYPNVAPEGQIVELPKGDLLGALNALSPFVGQDASRSWARGILLRGQSAYATNNIIAIEKWLGYHFPVDVNIPEEAVDELLRIGKEPTQIQLGQNSVTFHFGNNQWLRSQLLTVEWPDVSRILEKESKCKPVPEGFFQALQDLMPFVDDMTRVFFHDGEVSTVPLEGIGASVKVAGVPDGGCYNIKQLLHLDGTVREIDFSMFPDPCIFYGDKIRGAIVGMRF
jgi:DNA polymerase III sliding clamp (beta) subunit (PCNA family)